MTSSGLVSGHVYRREGARGPVWYAKYRLPDGTQIQKRIGPAWTQRGRPADGHFTKRTAEEWLRRELDQARAGLIVRTRVLFEEAAQEWLRYAVEVGRASRRRCTTTATPSGEC